MPATRPQKITLAEMRAANMRGHLIYSGDYYCSHWTAVSGDQWPDDIRLSDLEPRFTCQACGRRGAEVRPNFNWKEMRSPRTEWSGAESIHGASKRCRDSSPSVHLP